MPSLDDHFRALTTVRPPEHRPDFHGRPPRPMAPPPRRSQRVVAILVALLVAAGGIFAVTRAFDRDTRRHPTADLTPAVTPEPSPTATPSPSPSWTPNGGVFGAMYKAIRFSSPSGWTFSFTHDRVDGDWSIDGNVDDGAGPGRLYVDVTPRPGNLEAHPCDDLEFRQGGQCTEQPLANGDLLVMRNLVVDPGGTKTIEVVLIHPDRSGVGAEAGNFLAPVLPDGPVSKGQLPSSKVTRDEPLYTPEQLAKLVQAVNRVVEECLQTSC